jgi:nicotinate-nucleotide adenylyltransferase
MRVAIFGGSFNPPHLGHVDAARCALETLKPDKLLIVPAGEPPHKTLPGGSPGAGERLRMAELAFGELPRTEITDLELRRPGKSFTSDTLEEIAALYPGEELILVMGTDMLLTMERWHSFRRIMELAALAAFPREEGEREALERAAAHLTESYGARVTLLPKTPLAMNSTDLRDQLRERGGRQLLPEAVYAEIIRLRLYGAQPAFDWLRERAYAFLNPERVPHVAGCEAEAVRLAARWDGDVASAAEAAILHDMTKKLKLDEQLHLCGKYGIICDAVELENPKLLHAKTGAAMASDLFGVSDEVSRAILWHTTGRAGMTKLEQIIYLADYIEPTRGFEGVGRLRALTYEDLGAAMVLGLSMSLAEVRAKGSEPHPRTLAALDWFLSGKEGTYEALREQ